MLSIIMAKKQLMSVFFWFILSQVYHNLTVNFETILCITKIATREYTLAMPIPTGYNHLGEA